MERRLTAILAADVVGYSRMMGADEAGTHAALKALRAEIVDPGFAEHHGRIVKLMGDGAYAQVTVSTPCRSLCLPGAIPHSVSRHRCK